mgnify:CR=1 FL=1
MSHDKYYETFLFKITRSFWGIPSITCHIFQQGGKLVEAGALFAEVLAGFESGKGATHADTLSACANLGACRQAQGRFDEAQSLLRQMRGERVRPSLISFNLALDACAKGSAPEAALELMSALRAAATSPASTASRSVIVPPPLGVDGAAGGKRFGAIGFGGAGGSSSAT